MIILTQHQKFKVGVGWGQKLDADSHPLGAARSGPRLISLASDDKAARIDARNNGARMSTVAALKRALKGAGVEFIDENGGGPGVRLRKRQQKKARGL